VNTGRLSAVALDEVRTVFDTNVFGVIAVTKALLPLLRPVEVKCSCGHWLGRHNFMAAFPPTGSVTKCLRPRHRSAAPCQRPLNVA
jgi:NAD(P)-dependent dehydrogenase (short-subunit alcohol dehydrogenase family)